MCAPSGPKFLHFHAVFGKNWPNNRLAPPTLGLVPPPLGNPGSATALCSSTDILVVRYLVYKGGSPYESRTSRKNHQTVKCQIANGRNFSGILEELHQLPTQDQLNCIFWLFVPF